MTLATGAWCTGCCQIDPAQTSSQSTPWSLTSTILLSSNLDLTLRTLGILRIFSLKIFPSTCWACT